FAQRVILRATVILRGAPLALDQPGAFQPLECRKKRAGIHLEYALADLINALGNAPAMHGLKRQSFQDQHIQRALDQSCCFVCHWLYSSRFSRGSMRSLLEIVKRRKIVVRNYFCGRPGRSNARIRRWKSCGGSQSMVTVLPVP